MSTWQEEQAARETVLRDTLAAVAPLLTDAGPWHVETPEGRNARLVSADGVTVWASVETYGAKQGKLTLRAGVPEGASYEAGDYSRLVCPTITVSPDRAPAVLARDIMRRLIPGAVDYWQTVSGRIERRLSALSARETLARELADIMGAGARECRGEWRADLPDALSGHGPGGDNTYGDMTPDYDGSAVTVSIRGLSADRARELAAIVAGWAS